MPMNKDEVDKLNYVQFVLQASASSQKYGMIHEKERRGYKPIRANINSMLVMPFGSGKSTMISGVEGATYNNGVTFAGLIGTINKQGEVLKGSAFDAGGKLLVLDEFQAMHQSVKDAMNSLLEFPNRYNRVLGYIITESVNAKHIENYGKEKRVVSYIASKKGSNQVSMYSKFSCIASGMYCTKDTSIDMAFFSRFIPMRIVPKIEHYETVSSGDMNVEISPNIIATDFTFENYLEFHAKFFERFKKEAWFMKHREELGYSTRMLQDLVRVGGFIATLDRRTDIHLDDCMEAMDRCYKNMIESYKLADLDKLGEFVRQIKQKDKSITTREIAELAGVSQTSVERRIQQLEKIGDDTPLLPKMGGSKNGGMGGTELEIDKKGVLI